MKQKTLMEQLAPLFFPVEKIAAPNTGFGWDKSMDHLIVCTNPKTGDKTAVNACSKNYHLISNRELLEPLVQALGEEFGNIDAKVKTWNQSKFYTDFIIRDKSMEIIKGDTIFPKIRMNNSYDGSVKYQFTFGFFRLVCSNGMTAPVNGMKKLNIRTRHTPNAGAKAVAQTLGIIKDFVDDADKVLLGYKELVKTKVAWEEAIKRIELVGKSTKFPTKKTEDVVRRLEVEKNLGLPVNDFLIYNAFNHVLYNAETKQKEHKRDKVDLQVLNFITNGYTN